MSMTSCRPYMLRALYEWIVDNKCTPYLLVDAHFPGVSVPQNYVNEKGQIILNISPSAVNRFDVDNHQVSFSARFDGISNDISVPCAAVMSIYARENGQGMAFDPEPYNEPPPPKAPDPSTKPGGKRPGLRVVK